MSFRKAPLTNLLPVVPQGASRYERDLNVTLNTLIGDLNNRVNMLAEGRGVIHYNEDTAAPVSGSFRRGDIVRNSNPVSFSGSATINVVRVGWICISDGSASASSFAQLLTLTGV